MKTVKWLFTVGFFTLFFVNVQAQFPSGHWCSTTEGKQTKRCMALDGLKNKEKNLVITIPHRGLWGQKGKPEGSLQAMIDAYNADYMFIEADLVLTKDKVLALIHDQQTNRMLSTPLTFSADGGLHDNGSFIRSLNWNAPTLNSVPDQNGNIYSSYPPLKDALYKDRFGQVTTQKINKFEELADWMKNKEVIVFLDIKTGSMADVAIKNEYLEAIKLCLEIAKSKGILHQLVFKPGSSGQVTIADIKNYLSADLWTAFSNATNVVLINIIGGSFPLATNKKYLDDWFALPTLAGVELIYKTSNDEFLTPKAEFENKSIIKYAKDKGFRTGVFHPIPTDEYGAPGGRGNNFNPPNKTLTDLRGNIEFLFNSIPSELAPGMIVTDRPEMEISFFNLFNMNSKYTKRSNPY